MQQRSEATQEPRHAGMGEAWWKLGGSLGEAGAFQADLMRLLEDLFQQASQMSSTADLVCDLLCFVFYWGEMKNESFCWGLLVQGGELKRVREVWEFCRGGGGGLQGTSSLGGRTNSQVGGVGLVPALVSRRSPGKHPEDELGAFSAGFFGL